MNQIPGSQTNTNQASTSQTSANQATAGNGVPTALAAPTKTAARGTRWRRTIGPNDSKDSWGALLVAELGLLALGLGTLAGFCRLFDGWDFFVPLATITLGSWMAALVLRRTRIPMTIAAPVHIVLGVIAIGAMFVPESTILGAPVPAAFSAAVSEVTSSFTEIRTMVPPVEATTGFLIVIAAGFWLLALYADTAALRVDAVIQAAAPYLVTFLAVGIPSNGPDRLIGISSFVAGLVIYAAAIQFRRYSGLSWADRSPAVGARSVALTATGIAVAGAIVALIAGAALPTQDRRIDLREIGKGPGARTVVSPFVGVTTLLGTRSNSEMFRVRADKPSYWRLTALGSFDEERNIWISHDTYSPINGDIARSTPLGVPTNRLRQDYKISGLSGPWLPAAFEPGRISGEASATHDPMSASLIVDEESSSSLSYRVDSFLPDLEPVSEKLNTSSKQSGPSTLDPELLRVPALSLELRRAFDNATALGTNPYQKMVLLQDWFRSEFIYDEGVNYSGSGDPTTDFIEARRGFCQQFSSTFALLARHAGLPSRVAVGFTQGDAVVSDTPRPDGSSATEYVVKGRHAHAWPEVYFPEVGWVGFEPTPGRGNPATADFSGIAAAQAPIPIDEPTTTTVPVTAQPVPPRSVPPTTAAPAKQEMDKDSGLDMTTASVITGVVAVTLALLAVAFVIRPLRRRRHEDIRNSGSSQSARSLRRIQHSWDQCLRALALVGIRIESTETPLEFAARAGATLESKATGREDSHYPQLPGGQSGDSPTSPSADLLSLAEAETFRRYASEIPATPDRSHNEMSEPPSEADIPAEAEAASLRIQSWTRQLSTRFERIEHRVRA